MPLWVQIVVALATPATVVVSFLTYQLTRKKTNRDDLRQTAEFYQSRWQEETEENERLRKSIDKLREEIGTLTNTVIKLKTEITKLKSSK